MVRRLGGVPLCYPLIQIVPARTQDFLAALREPVDALVFTSVNGVESFIAGRQEAGMVSPPPPAYCVGAATGQAAVRAGLTVRAIPGVAAASHMRGVLEKEYGSPGRVLLVQGREAGTALQDDLSAHGWQVVAAIGYETQATPQAHACVLAVRRGEIDALTFASGSAVRAFYRAWIHGQAQPSCMLQESVLVASIGPKTTEVLRRLGIEPQVTSVTASGHALIEALFAYWAAKDTPFTV